MIEMTVCWEPPIGEEPKKGFDLVRGVHFLDFWVDGIVCTVFIHYGMLFEEDGIMLLVVNLPLEEQFQMTASMLVSLALIGMLVMTCLMIIERSKGIRVKSQLPFL